MQQKTTGDDDAVSFRKSKGHVKRAIIIYYDELC